MDVADDVSGSIGLGKYDMVVRHGIPVNFTSIDNPKEIPDYIAKKNFGISRERL